MERIATIARRLAAIAAAASVVVLAGCSSGPTDADRAAWTQWSDAVVAGTSGSAAAGQLGVVGSGAAATLDFPSATAFRAIELRCIGADRAQFALTYTAGAQTLSTSQDIVCQKGALRTPIAIPSAVKSLTSVTVSATSPDGAGMWTAQLQK